MSSEAYIKSIIQTQGPLSIAQFMSIALSDPHYGYYMQHEPIGKEGDFITAPEISQMFGEMIGVWCANTWELIGAPKQCALVELGPGYGTLMNDLLRASKSAPGFLEHVTVHLIEISPSLIMKQKEQLADAPIDIQWHTTLTDIPDIPMIIVANEFFDALPIHQFVKTDDGWREKMIALDDKEALTFALAPTETPHNALIPKHYASQPEHAVFEVCPAAITITTDIAKHIEDHGGAALFIDYGYEENTFQDSLQSVKEHCFHPILEEPGQADITAHVDFSALKNATIDSHISTYGPISQTMLLESLGINIRAEMLAQQATQEQQESLISSLQRLTSPEQMGSLFKCMSILPENIPAPIGFEYAHLSEVK